MALAIYLIGHQISTFTPICRVFRLVVFFLTIIRPKFTLSCANMMVRYIYTSGLFLNSFLTLNFNSYPSIFQYNIEALFCFLFSVSLRIKHVFHIYLSHKCWIRQCRAKFCYREGLFHLCHVGGV